jgi:hypothetical protein
MPWQASVSSTSCQIIASSLHLYSYRWYHMPFGCDDTHTYYSGSDRCNVCMYVATYSSLWLLLLPLSTTFTSAYIALHKPATHAGSQSALLRQTDVHTIQSAAFTNCIKYEQSIQRQLQLDQEVQEVWSLNASIHRRVTSYLRVCNTSNK